MSLIKCFIPFGVSVSFVQVARALNLSFTGNDCPTNPNEIYSETAYFNASDTTEFYVQGLGDDASEPWYYSLTLMDERGSKYGPYINRWLSVPKSYMESEFGKDTSLCMYTSEGVDKSMENTQENANCDGIVSDECTEAFSSVKPASAGQQCHSPPNRDACGDGIAIAWRATAQGLSKDTCHVKTLPGVNIPDNYLTFNIFDLGYGSNFNLSSYKHYDAALKEPIATLLAINVRSRGVLISGTEPYTQAVCAIPNKVQKDSRNVTESEGSEDDEDDNEEDRDNTAGGLDASKSAVIAFAIVSLGVSINFF